EFINNIKLADNDRSRFQPGRLDKFYGLGQFPGNNEEIVPDPDIFVQGIDRIKKTNPVHHWVAEGQQIFITSGFQFLCAEAL
ncbi:MAG: hypothetical protein ACM3KE_19280, partial [Hyphomicrobiales bacterium]